MKQQLIRRQFGREPMYHSGPPSINVSDVTDGGDGKAVRFRLLPRSGQLSVDGAPADLGGPRSRSSDGVDQGARHRRATA